PELLPRIFGLFVQGDRALDRSQGGLGIGLTLARSLVEAHGGTIVAKSDGPGMGSEFIVHLPALARQVPHEKEPSHSVRPKPPGHRSGLRILVVDDNIDAAEVLAEGLRSFGHEIAIAHDGPGALTIAPGFRPNTAILDIGLPAMDGYELA